MELAHGVRAGREPEGERGHVELGCGTVDATAKLEDPLDRHAAGVRPAIAFEERARDPPHEVGVEALVSGRHGGVDREDAVGADGVPRFVQRSARRD